MTWWARPSYTIALEGESGGRGDTEHSGIEAYEDRHDDSDDNNNFLFG